MERPFSQVDVFTEEPYVGNPVAVVVDAKGLSTEEMQRFARWTNLSETTFVLPPQAAGADYRVRIFTPSRELPFAGHPTLGTCHAWLAHGGTPHRGHVVVQECEAGLIELRRDAGPGGNLLAFAAPPLLRSGPVDEKTLLHLIDVLNLHPSHVVDAQWVDNGPGWVAVLLASADAVLAVHPDQSELDIGVVGPYPPGVAGSVRGPGLHPGPGRLRRGPGDRKPERGPWPAGSWDSGRASAPYVASQGTVMGRRGRVHISRDDDGTIWVGGGTVSCLQGTANL